MTFRRKEARVSEIEAQTQEDGFWDDGRSAQKVLREADGLRSEIATWQELLTRADDLLAAVELLYEAPDAELEAELERDFASLDTDFARERTALLFSGEYDERPALLSISAGAGGTEATDWTEMLLRMYLRWAERHRFPTEILDQQEGEQAGLKSVTVAVNGRRAYGWLRAERGVHRLVRISPFDSQNRRQTTFALVEVLPEADDDVEIELDWDQIRVDTFRSQGAGGQHVNKTDSAVRLTDLPDRDRRPEPERAEPDPEQGDGDQGPQVPAARARARGEGGSRSGRSRASTSRPAGATRSGATSCIPTRWSRTCGPTTRPATPAPSSTATSTRSCRPSSSARIGEEGARLVSGGRGTGAGAGGSAAR